jgi:large subunit ribosomal protein L15
MTVNTRKKSSRHRGSRRCSWGTKKRHRGAGNRGGRGMAGTGKKADDKKPSIWKNAKYFGKLGFVNHQKEKIVYQNIGYIESRLEEFVAKKLISKEGDTYVIDSKKMKFNKLLGKGTVMKKFKINVPYASKNAIAIVEKAGGKVNCKEVKVNKVKEEKEDK